MYHCEHRACPQGHITPRPCKGSNNHEQCITSLQLWIALQWFYTKKELNYKFFYRSFVFNLNLKVASQLWLHLPADNSQQQPFVVSRGVPFNHLVDGLVIAVQERFLYFHQVNLQDGIVSECSDAELSKFQVSAFTVMALIYGPHTHSYTSVIQAGTAKSTLILWVNQPLIQNLCRHNIIIVLLNLAYIISN